MYNYLAGDLLQLQTPPEEHHPKGASRENIATQVSKTTYSSRETQSMMMLDHTRNLALEQMQSLIQMQQIQNRMSASLFALTTPIPSASVYAHSTPSSLWNNTPSGTIAYAQVPPHQITSSHMQPHYMQSDPMRYRSASIQSTTPLMYPGMPPSMHPGMYSGMNPGMHHSMNSGIHPSINPGIHPAMPQPPAPMESPIPRSMSPLPQHDVRYSTPNPQAPPPSHGLITGPYNVNTSNKNVSFSNNRDSLASDSSVISKKKTRRNKIKAETTPSSSTTPTNTSKQGDEYTEYNTSLGHGLSSIT